MTLELNVSGFPIPPESWWQGKIETRYGKVSREYIAGLCVERYNVCMDDYAGHSDSELAEAYVLCWGNIVSSFADSIEGLTVAYSVNKGVWFYTNRYYPEIVGAAADDWDAFVDLEAKILRTNDCRWIIR